MKPNFLIFQNLSCVTDPLKPLSANATLIEHDKKSFVAKVEMSVQFHPASVQSHVNISYGLFRQPGNTTQDYKIFALDNFTDLGGK